MKKSGLLILVMALMLTACRTGEEKPEESTKPETHPSVTDTPFAEPGMADVSELLEETVPQDKEDPAVNALGGPWVLEYLEIEGEQRSADEEGIHSTLDFYYNVDETFCADYTYGNVGSAEGDRVMLEVPVYQYSPEAEDDRLKVWLDCSAYPPIFEETQGEEYDLWFSEQGNLILQFVSHTPGDYGTYCVIYTYVRPENKQSLPGEKMELTVQYIEEGQFESYESDGTAIIAEIDSIGEMGIPILVQTNTTIESLCVVELAYNEEKWQLEPQNELREFNQITPSDKLVLRIAFPGDVPNRGLQITKDGITKIYALEISGYDGSLQLYEQE